MPVLQTVVDRLCAGCTFFPLSFSLTTLIGMTNSWPWIWVPLSSVAPATRMPTALPSASRTGPPELPGLAGAWVWKMGVPALLAFLADSGPSATVGCTVESSDRPEANVDAYG